MINVTQKSEENSDNKKNNSKSSVEIKTLTDISHTDSDHLTQHKPQQNTGPSNSSESPPQNSGKTSKKKFNFRTLVGVIVLTLLILGSGAGFYLTQYTQQDIRQQAYDDPTPGDCSGCVGSCGSTGCNTSCPEGINPKDDCGIWQARFMCEGRRHDGCNDATCIKQGSSCVGMPEPFNYASNPETWCKTYQFDSNAPNGAYTVVYVGDGGEYCVTTGGQPDNCDPDDLDWDCSETQEVSCQNLTGTIKTGSVENLSDPLDFLISFDGDDVSRVELVAHGNFTPPSMGSNWAVMSRTDSPPASGTYSGTTTYQAMVDALVATGHDRDRLLNEDIVFYANVFGPKGFCTGGGTWSGTGEPCSPNSACNGTISLTPDEPTSKTFNISSEFICPDGTTPSEIERRLAWRIWPPTNAIWNYNPKLDFSGVTDNVSQSVTIPDINEVSNQSIYVALVEGSLFHTWWSNGDDDLEPYKAIQDPAYPAIEAGDFFEEPMFRIKVADPTVPENITLKFEAPEELCTEPVMCKDVAILDQNNNELNPTASPSPFSIGQVIKFRCAADDPTSPLIEKFEFRITEPDGTVVQGGTINPGGKSAISQNYQITQNGTFTAQCRICETDGTCQPYVSIGAN